MFAVLAVCLAENTTLDIKYICHFGKHILDINVHACHADKMHAAIVLCVAVDCDASCEMCTM